MSIPTRKRTIDEQILHLLHTDPSEGIRLLMEQYMGLLWSACRRYLENPEDIRECLQDVLMDFYEKRDRFHPEKGTLKAYLYVIARRKALQKAKQNGMYDLESYPENLADGQDETEQILDRVMLEQALQTLREEDSRMIRMKYYDGMTCAEIARSMKLPLETVKKRQQRSLKKLHRILIALAVLGILTACAAAAAYRFRFSPSTGFQKMDGEIWYEMADGPVVIETVYGEVTVESLIWEDQTLYLTAEFADTGLDADQLEDAFVLIDPDTGQELRSGNFGTRRGGDLPIWMEQTWMAPKAREQYCILVYGEKHMFSMEPIEEYEDFSQIGQSQTHRGRTIVLCASEEDGKLLADAYVYSEDPWKIIRFGGLWDTDWKSRTLPGESRSWSSRKFSGEQVFHYETDAGEGLPDTLEIDTTILQYTEEIPVIEIPIPEEAEEVDLPFSAGGDTYRIVKISWSRGTYERTSVDEHGQETSVYDDELLIEMVPDHLEEHTRFLSVSGDLGLMNIGKRFRMNEETGKMEEVGSTESFQSKWYAGWGYPAESVIRIPISETEELPERVYLQITGIWKYWDQKFYFPL